MKRTILTAAMVLALSTPALAFHCPADIAAIDEALANDPGLTEEELAEVREYRDEGERLHEAGEHGESVEVLAKAKAMLGID